MNQAQDKDFCEKAVEMMICTQLLPLYIAFHHFRKKACIFLDLEILRLRVLHLSFGSQQLSFRVVYLVFSRRTRLRTRTMLFGYVKK